MDINMNEIDIDYMKFALAEYYENAGFANVYEREIKNYSVEMTIKAFKDVFGEDEPMYDKGITE